MIDTGALTVEELCERLMFLCEVRKNKNKMHVPVSFYRMVDGKPKRVSTVGYSPSVPIDFTYSGIDWDADTSFVHTPIKLYADWDEYRSYINGMEDKGDET